jgi:prolyl oligopeptidase
MRVRLHLACLGLLCWSAMGQITETKAGAAPAGPPKAKSQPVEDTLFGHRIVDPYRWMEDADSPETQRYVADQNAYTRHMLDPLPGREKIRARLEQLLSIGSITPPQVAGKYYFYTRREGTQNQPVLFVREGVDGKDRVLLDPNQLSSDGTVALDWWQPTEDGKLLCYGTSASGSEMSTLRIRETATGKDRPETIERTRAASVAWLPDNSAFYYTRYPKPGDVPAGQEMYNRHVFFHKLGSAADGNADALIFGAKPDGSKLDPTDWPDVNLSEDGRWLVIMIAEGWAKSELFLKDLKSDKPPMELTSGKTFLYDAQVFQGQVYIHTNEDAPRYRVLRVDAQNPARANWKEIIPQSDAVLTGIGVAGGKLIAGYEKNATSQLAIFSTDGKRLAAPELPGLGSVLGFGGQWNSKEAFYGFNSFTVPPSIYHYDLESGKTTAWAKVDAPLDPMAFEVKQVWYASKDGTRVPMFVVARKGLALDGKTPTLLSGYGGFNVSMTPTFSRGLYLWLEHGGIYALANLRGGAEFGEDWHRGGMLDKKQNVFDDFIAAGEYLIAQHYTDRAHLAIQGGSNGGLLVGAALTQRPDLFRAVVCQVPLLDMLRYERFQIAKLWAAEYGSASDAKQFEWLLSYSPYQHVKDGTAYPAILLMTADSDSRVDPMHAKKMAARLQAATSSSNPILLRVDTKAGHGAGKPVSKLIDDGTDIWSFLFWQLGVTP